ncbi:MAG: 3-phosphoshikimate 1-carboxyvinyltransferase [Spirochaetes bacterium GWB1_48_6]|nr:MAG: 3-phosphoshikimate 1-carboxyvinyltransferase [Spirochaetes bacterium GWB1_48_6]
MKNIPQAKPRHIIVSAPPAKAYTLRALLLGALAEGKTKLRHPLLAEDQVNMIACLEGLGVKIKTTPDLVEIEGCGGRFLPVKEELFVGDSGVTMNFLISALSFAHRPVILGGTPRLNERPVGEVVEGIRQLGARVEYLGKEGFPPLKVHPLGLNGGHTSLHGAVTSQYFSSLVISSALARGSVTLECLDTMTERPYFDISTSMMSTFGVSCTNKDYTQIEIPAPQKYLARDLEIEGDFSSASFLFLVAAVLKSSVTVVGLNRNSVQGDKRFLDLLELMGCRVSWDNDAVTVTGGELRGIEADMGDVPDLVPPLAIAAAFATGESQFTRIGHLVHKESNRVVAMETELAKMGCISHHDTQTYTIVGNPSGLKGAVIHPYNDHRIAMSFAVAGLATGGQTLENPECVAKSFPDFWEKLELFY